MTESILEEAQRLIHGDRAKDYGDVTENFTRIADMWGAYLGQSDMLTPHDVAQMMILVKVARQAGGYHRDSNVDIAGYAALDEQVHGGAEFDRNVVGMRLDTETLIHVDDVAKSKMMEPRSWNFINDKIPYDVTTLVDIDNDLWVRPDVTSEWHCSNEDKGLGSQYCGPFTESWPANDQEGNA